jgi:hypothetical protein
MAKFSFAFLLGCAACRNPARLKKIAAAIAEGKMKSGRSSDKIPTVPAAKLAMPSSRTSGRASSPWISKICSAVNLERRTRKRPGAAALLGS